MDRYTSPFTDRYGSETMRILFSPLNKYETWRELWVSLAKAEQTLGLPITDEQIEELESHIYDINIDVALERERTTRHDVMSHIYAYGVQCPKASGIIHLGATSAYVVDNADIIIMRSALRQIYIDLTALINALKRLAERYKDVPTLAYTHFQPAQPTTVGKRICMWMQDFQMDKEDLKHILSTMKLLGCKGATGTQASFLELFDGNMESVKKLDTLIADMFGFDSCYPISGQTYSRKLDARIANVLSGIATSASKMSTDIRLLQHTKEMCESFKAGQVGSSAMAYKKNPITCEKITSLSRFVMVNALNPSITSATQWLERSLDDSANKRVVIPELFLAIDEIINSCYDVVNHLVVNEDVISRKLEENMHHIVTENKIMDAVKNGGNRQEEHEKIRMAMVTAYEEDNLPFATAHKPIDYIGCAVDQVEQFLNYKER